MKSFKKGFTLIELMVVIAIIGLLSSVVLANLKVSRDKALNAKRSLDIRTYITVFDLYADDNKYYPNPSLLTQAHCLGTNNGCRYFTLLPADNILNNMIKNYIPGLPNETTPVGSAGYYGYIYFCPTTDAATHCLKYDLYWTQSGSGANCGLGTQNFGGTDYTLCLYTSPQIQ